MLFKDSNNETNIMSKSKNNQHQGRPPSIKLGDAPETDSNSGDHIFRFELNKKPDNIDSDNLFDWVVQEQLRALLDIVELADDDKVLTITKYRYRNEKDFKDLYSK